MWDGHNGRLLWVDILRGEVHSFDPVTRQDATFDVGQHVGMVALRKGGGLILAVPDGFAMLDDDGELTRITYVESDLPGNKMNDGKCDSRGRLWAGSAPYDETQFGAGSLYRLNTDLTVHKMVEHVTVSNGLDWSLDDSLMYYIDSVTYSVDVFDFDAPTGEIRNRRTLFEIDRELGEPDGMTLDADGFLWVAIWDGRCVNRYTPEGRLDGQISVPGGKVASCSFGGRDLADLYITTATETLTAEQLDNEPLAGGLFRARPGVVGRQANMFDG